MHPKIRVVDKWEREDLCVIVGHLSQCFLFGKFSGWFFMFSDLLRMHKSCLMPVTGFSCPVVLGWYVTCVQGKSVTLMSLVNKGVFQYSLHVYKTACIQMFILSALAFVVLSLVYRIFEDRILILVL